ncbi:CADM2-like protein [Mya arenaria]|uniref:CADM2-like protein n=1 Tax=Mya arenaria TaxID=6604 RepID=A0ABY7EDF4_MYAAR|nr:CADM2-like protein [Mya arenaria]
MILNMEKVYIRVLICIVKMIVLALKCADAATLTISSPSNCGKDTTLTCMDANPFSFWAIYHNGLKILTETANFPKYSSTLSENTLVVTIHYTSLNDIGRYTCFADYTQSMNVSLLFECKATAVIETILNTKKLKLQLEKVYPRNISLTASFESGGISAVLGGTPICKPSTTFEATPDAPTFSNIANENNQVVLRGDVGSPLNVTCTSSGGYPVQTVVLYFDDSAIIVSMTDQTAREGDTKFALKCQAWSKPPATFRWYKEGNTTLLRQSTGTLDDNSGTYVIPFVSRLHAALNTTITGHTDIYGNGINKVTLTCSTGSSNPSSNITWYRNSQHITSSNPVTNSAGDYGGKITSQILEFVPTREMDGHVLECRAGNGMSSSVAQWARVDDPIVSVTTGSVEMDETHSGSLSCTVDSKPPSTITWSRVDSASALPTDSMTRGNNSLKYRINTAQREDAGQYRCTANNIFGGNKHNHTQIVVRYVLTLTRLTYEDSGVYTCKVENGVPYSRNASAAYPVIANAETTINVAVQIGNVSEFSAEFFSNTQDATTKIRIALQRVRNKKNRSGAVNPNFDAAQTYEDVSMTTGTSVYDALS